MTKKQMLDELKKLHGKNYNHAYLSKKSVEELRVILLRWRAIAAVTEKEMRFHCDVSFIK